MVAALQTEGWLRRVADSQVVLATAAVAVECLAMRWGGIGSVRGSGGVGCGWVAGVCGGRKKWKGRPAGPRRLLFSAGSGQQAESRATSLGRLAWLVWLA